MVDIDVFSSGISEKLIITIIITATIHIVLYLSSSRTRHQYKKFKMWLSQSETKLEMVSKAWPSKSDNLQLDYVKKKIKSCIMCNNYLIHDNGDFLLIKMDNIDVNVSFYTDEIYTENDDIHLAVSGLELRFTSKCTFRKFRDSVFDLRESMNKIEKILQKECYDVKDEFIFICTIKNMSIAKMLLGNGEQFTINYETNDNRKFEIHNNKIICYDSDISSRRLNLIKKIIVVYS